MSNEKYESLGALQKKIYDHVCTAINDGEYEINLNSKCFAADGYVDGTLTIGGFQISCSFNKGGYICWHCGREIECLIENVPCIKPILCGKVKNMVSSYSEELRLERIAELEDELRRLKGEEP